LESFPLPVLRTGEALVRIRCATLCASDLHTLRGRRPAPTPSILGHEMVGDIVTANDVSDYFGRPLTPGSRVTWSMLWSCKQCFYCLLGLPSKCERLFKFGHEALHPDRPLSGAFAQHCHLPLGTAIFPVPLNISDESAASANCATATVAAVLRHAGALAGQSVLILGAGMLGLTACAMAATAGATCIIAVDRDSQRLALASRFGANFAFSADESLRDLVMHAASGRGVDIALEFAGTPQAAEVALTLLRSGGHLILAGAVFPSSPINLHAEDIVRRMLRITGVYNYQPEDLGFALRFLSQTQSRFPFASLVGKRFPLTDINAAIAFAEREKPPRVALIPS